MLKQKVHFLWNEFIILYGFMLILCQICSILGNLQSLVKHHQQHRGSPAGCSVLYHPLREEIWPSCFECNSHEDRPVPSKFCLNWPPFSHHFLWAGLQTDSWNKSTDNFKLLAKVAKTCYKVKCSCVFWSLKFENSNARHGKCCYICIKCR